MSSHAVASSEGLTFAFYFFLAFSGVIAISVYILLTRLSARRVQMGMGVVRRAIAGPIALLVWLVVFLAIYMTSLAGFHTVTVSDDEVEVAYAVPRRSISLPLEDIGDVIRRPAFRTLWQLEIYTITGTRFASAPGSYRSVRDAALEIEQRRTR